MSEGGRAKMAEGSPTKGAALPPGPAGIEGRAPRSGGAARLQVGALPFRKAPSGAIEILLITSRETGRFIIPKGWPMKRLTNPAAAAREAYEEAGVSGKIKRQPVGAYLYRKRVARRSELIKVTVYALEVQAEHAEWPEKGARQLRWVSREEAATLVDAPGLMKLVSEFEA
jgi:8-oxo-dGTP pyrophosphatase MutT (NUDIX family)